MPIKIDHSPYPCEPQPTMLEDFHTSIKRLVEDLMEDPRTKSLRDEFSAELHLAAIVKRGKIIATATNRYGTRSRFAGACRSSYHAEKSVVRQLGDVMQLRGADMFVMRFTKNRRLEGYERFRCSKPCYSCQIFLEKCIREYGLRHVYYTS